MQYMKETVGVFYDEAYPLILDYWAEADERRDSVPANIDRATYEKLESLGLLAIYTVREDEALAGFIVFLLSPCTHTGELKATTEISYLVPEFRGQSIMPDFYSAVEKDLKEAGVNRLFWTIKTEMPHNSLMESLGLKHVENVYMKEVI